MIQFPRGYNGVGLHGVPEPYSSHRGYHEALDWAHELRARGFTAYKLLGDDSRLEEARAFRDLGFFLIYRPVISLEGPWYYPPHRWVASGKTLKAWHGIADLIELGNEFQIKAEWGEGRAVPPPDKMAPVVANAWEVMLNSGAACGIPVLFPSASPGDTREYYRAIFAEIAARGLQSTVEYVAVHTRPHNLRPHYPPTDEVTVSFREHERIYQAAVDAGIPDPLLVVTEHGTSPGDEQYKGAPKVTLDIWLRRNWAFFVRMNPKHKWAIPAYVAGLFYWHSGPKAGEGCAWPHDSLVNAPWPPEMQPNSPLWDRMAERAHMLNFERYPDGGRSGSIPTKEWNND